MTGNATNYKNSQGNNPICSTRDEIWHPSRQFHHERHWLNACLVRKIDFWRSVIQMRKKQQISTILNLSMPFYTLQQIFCLKENTATSIKQERTYLDLTCLVVSLSLHFWYRNMKENIKSSAYLHFHCKTYFWCHSTLTQTSAYWT